MGWCIVGLIKSVIQYFLVTHKSLLMKDQEAEHNINVILETVVLGCTCPDISDLMNALRQVSPREKRWRAGMGWGIRRNAKGKPTRNQQRALEVSRLFWISRGGPIKCF